MKNPPSKNLLKLAKHFIFSRYAITNSRQQLRIISILNPLKKQGLVDYRSYVIHFFSYISKSFSVQQKAIIIANHYSFLRKKISEEYLNQIFENGFNCYSECGQGDEYTVTLSPSSQLEFEGSLSLFFKVNNIKTYTLSFTFVPGQIFNISKDNVIYISRMQRAADQVDNNVKALHNFMDIIPSAILMKVLEAIASSLAIDTFAGISANNQLSLGSDEKYEKFYSNYDEFWLSMGGILKDGSYFLSFPIPQKDILLIKQNHRTRTLKKRRRLHEIYTQSCSNMTRIVN
jgi:uncharacterized protein VirK/YbjX